MENDNILRLVIGENVPRNILNEFDIVKFYLRNIDGNLSLYADISLPYLINHVEFLDIKDDPRYYFYEGYDSQTKGCKYICEVKPYGMMKGIYRILNGERIKIGNIEPLFELENNGNVKKLKKKGGEF